MPSSRLLSVPLSMSSWSLFRGLVLQWAPYRLETGDHCCPRYIYRECAGSTFSLSTTGRASLSFCLPWLVLTDSGGLGHLVPGKFGLPRVTCAGFGGLGFPLALHHIVSVIRRSTPPLHTWMQFFVGEHSRTNSFRSLLNLRYLPCSTKPLSQLVPWLGSFDAVHYTPRDTSGQELETQASQGFETKKK